MGSEMCIRDRLVDGPIVITEYARSEQERGVRRRDSYINSSHTMFWPIVASSLTTIAAFFPLLFWPDMLGQWLRVIPLTVIVVLSTSLVVSLIFLPAMGSMIERKTAQMSDENKRKEGYFLRVYERSVSRAIRSPLIVLLLTIFTFLSVIFIYSQYNNGVIFFPNDKATNARVEVMARGNFSPTETAEYIKEVVEVVESNPYIGNYVANTINRNRIWLFDQSPTDIVGRLWIDLIPEDERPDSDLVLQDIQDELSKISGYEARISGNTYSSAIVGPKDIEIEISSANKFVLRQVAEIIKDKLANSKEVKDIEIKYPITGVEWEYKVDRKQTGKYNVSIQQIGSIINLATTGAKIGALRPINKNEEIDIKLFLPEDMRSLDEVENLFIQTDFGSVPISRFIEKEPNKKIFSIGRKNSSRILMVDANTADGYKTADQILSLIHI